MFDDVIENEIYLADKTNIPENIFDKMDYEIDSIMRVIDRKTE